VDLATGAFDSLAVVGGAFGVGGAAGYIAALTAQAVAPERDISRTVWGNEAGLALSALSLIGVVDFWVVRAIRGG
jgi:hypothetical protein